MKNLLTILFLAFTFSASAQTYTVVSTTTNRTLAITPLAVQLVSSNTAAGVRTLLNVTNATGLEATAANLMTVSNTVTTQGNTLATNAALLNGTNTFTGANQFPSASFYQKNALGMRLLWASPTNIFIPVMGPQNLGWTNSADYGIASNHFSITIPPLIGRNSQIVITGIRSQTNVNTAANGEIAVYIGSATNFIAATAAFTTVNNSSAAIFGINSPIFTSAASWTNQLGNNTTFNAYPLITNYCDTSVSNTLYFAFFSTSGSLRTNDIIAGMSVYELVK